MVGQEGNFIERFEFADGTTLSKIQWDAANNRTLLWGTNAADTINGTAGNDVIFSGPGADKMAGGLGNDVYYVEAAGELVTEAVSAGTDTVVSTVSISALAANVEYLTLSGTAAINGTGNALANIVTGNAAVNAIGGGAGNDLLIGRAGADTLVGGTGNDAFRFYAVSEFGDAVVDFANVAGNDDRFDFDASGIGGGLAVGFLNAAFFQSRADNLAQDANDRFIFRTTDQTLWFDANGNAAGGLTMVADLQTGASVTAGDILLF
jgi:Ca2+-binding RTX toxin-like protein